MLRHTTKPRSVLRPAEISCLVFVVCVLLASSTYSYAPVQEKHRRSNSNTPAGSYERPNSFGKHVNGFDKRKVRSGGSNGWDHKAAPPSRPSHSAATPGDHAAAAQLPDTNGAASAASTGGVYPNKSVAADAGVSNEAALVNGVA